MFRTSIVVLCYNGLEETTRPCLESLIANTPVDSYELIVVDNASADGTAQYLQSFATQHANVRIQLNDTNKGYAGGNNDGIKLAQGQYIVLLNNDTLVPGGWLDRLLKLFSEQPGVGLVGPVTNSAGNEQRIELEGLNEKNFEEIADAYVERQKGVWFTTEKLGFFCVAMRRTLLDKIGYLDEKFGIGMFEDDDYCIRAKKAGFALAVVEDCFVYHKGSVSFGKLAAESHCALFEKNKAYFREKHGIEWTLTDIAFSYWEKLDRDLLAHVKNSKVVSPEIERILVRHGNFKHLLVQVHYVELSSVPFNIRAASGHHVAIHAKWQTRWHNFKRNVIHGTNTEKLRYIRMVSGRILHRFGFTRRTRVQQEALKMLNAIRETLNGRKLVIFPATVDFHYMAQRPQHLARAFAEAGYVVIYGTLNYQVDKVAITEQVADDLYLLKEHYFPFISQVFKPEESIYYCLWPNNVKHLKYLPYSYLLYDYMDELSLLDLPSNELGRDHLTMLNRADLVTVSADKLMSQLPKCVLPKALLINNAVSQEFIDAVDACDQPPAELEAFNDHPILGYFGAIAEWVDFDLLDRLAEELPDSRIVLIGPVTESVSKRVEKLLQCHLNIVVLSARKQLELIPLLKRFDVCLIPFVKNAVTDAVSPVKLFEYFSAGKPVVTTNLFECAKYSSVHIAKDRQQFVNLVHDAVSERLVKPDAIAQKFALNNTWKHRVQQIRSRLQLKDALPENTLLDEVQNELAAGLQTERVDLYEFYLGQYAVQERQYWAPVTEWIDKLGDIRTLIDIGPAYGTLLLYTISKCHPGKKLAWDKIRFMPGAAVEKYGIEYQSLDIERDQIPSHLNADLIVFTEVIEHLNFHPLTTLQKLREMLSPNGTLILTTPDAAEWGRVTQYYQSVNEIPAYDGQTSDWIDGHIWQYEKGELDSLLCEAGFIIKSFDYAPGVCGRHLCYQLMKSVL